MYEMPVLAGAMLVVFLGAALQGSVGFGYAVLSVPLLTLLDPRFVPVAPQIIAFFLSVAALLRERGGLDTAGVGWIIVGRVPGALLAAAVLSVVVDRTLDLLIGSIVLVAVLLLATGISVPLNTSTRIAAGLFSGFSGTASAIGGPPVALLYRNQTGPTVRSTLGTIFAIGIVINLVVLTLTGILDSDDLKTAAMLAPASFLGFAGSSLLHRRVEGRVLRNGILAVASVSAVGLLTRAALG
ncbi:MAG: sulfite exporter TauE/SafE family protein [Acidimicrobiia bacterium]|nr:sulfite exporter TauE/SafE family protein [Acidimicrobiia bacterium]